MGTKRRHLLCQEFRPILGSRRTCLVRAQTGRRVYHLRKWPANQKHIIEPWRNAVATNLYKGVKARGGVTIEKAYALKNQMEYFAELSAIYFVGNDYYPFNRAQLKQYDPQGYAMVQTMWAVRDEPSEIAK